jgi:nitroimidazol reductase NimA-like FMN-containing flavoprotein (pyridoxamine 5'-phosphate oxidase superfamily)
MQSESTRDEDLDPGSLDEIGVEECWQLLSSQPIGRVAVIVGHYPLVFPVNYTVDGQAIVYRTNIGTKLWAIHRSNVTFQVDEIDQVHRSGWSVMVKGVAQELSAKRSNQVLASAELAETASWAPGTRDHFIRILPDEVTGRRISPAELAPATDARGYL